MIPLAIWFLPVIVIQIVSPSLLSSITMVMWRGRVARVVLSAALGGPRPCTSAFRLLARIYWFPFSASSSKTSSRLRR